MISSFDDYPVHQGVMPINQPTTSDRNYYDRYWFNGFAKDAGSTFEVGFGIYPNRFVMDGHFSIAVDGVQHSFHASRRAPKDRAETEVGPLSIEIIRPLKIVRVKLDPNETGIECDLTFFGRTVPTQEPMNVMYDDIHLIMENTRFTQFGVWEGQVSVGGTKIDYVRTGTYGTRDRSWGVRPIGEPQGGAPGLLNEEPGVYWVWSPIHFDDICTQFGSFEDRDGNPTQLSAAVVPAYGSVDDIPDGEETGHREMKTARHEIGWQTGTRWAKSAHFELVTRDNEVLEIDLEPQARIHLLGIGYQHPEWGHGIWHSDLAHASESWRLDEIEPLDMKHFHTHYICRATMGDRVGVGTLETMVIGRHVRSGFKDFFDGAP